MQPELPKVNQARATRGDILARDGAAIAEPIAVISDSRADVLGPL